MQNLWQPARFHISSRGKVPKMSEHRLRAVSMFHQSGTKILDLLPLLSRAVKFLLINFVEIKLLVKIF